MLKVDYLGNYLNSSLPAPLHSPSLFYYYQLFIEIGDYFNKKEIIKETVM